MGKGWEVTNSGFSRFARARGIDKADATMYKYPVRVVPMAIRS